VTCFRCSACGWPFLFKYLTRTHLMSSWSPSDSSRSSHQIPFANKALAILMGLRIFGRSTGAASRDSCSVVRIVKRLAGVDDPGRVDGLWLIFGSALKLPVLFTFVRMQNALQLLKARTPGGVRSLKSFKLWDNIDFDLVVKLPFAQISNTWQYCRCVNIFAY